MSDFLCQLNYFILYNILQLNNNFVQHWVYDFSSFFFAIYLMYLHVQCIMHMQNIFFFVKKNVFRVLYVMTMFVFVILFFFLTTQLKSFVLLCDFPVIFDILLNYMNVNIMSTTIKFHLISQCLTVIRLSLSHVTIFILFFRSFRYLHTYL